MLLLGPSGCGKSDLVLRLIDRGFLLVGDDRIDIENGRVSPAAGLEGLIEVRGLGILRLPWRGSARLRLACQLAEAPPRLPEAAMHGPGVPLLVIDPRPASAPLLLAHALDCLRGGTSMQSGAFA